MALLDPPRTLFCFVLFIYWCCFFGSTCRRTGLNDDLGAFPDMQIGFFCGVADLDAIRNMNFPPPAALGMS